MSLNIYFGIFWVLHKNFLKEYVTMNDKHIHLKILPKSLGLAILQLPASAHNFMRLDSKSYILWDSLLGQARTKTFLFPVDGRWQCQLLNQSLEVQ